MNKDELFLDSVEPNKFIIGKEDHDLLNAVKFLLEHGSTSITSGENARLVVMSHGYSYDARIDNIMRYADSRKTELIAYRKRLEENVYQTQALIGILPKE